MLQDKRGNIAVTFALISPILLAFVGGAIDYWRFANAHLTLQSIAESSAIGGAREWVLATSENRIPIQVAERYAEASLRSTTSGKGAKLNVKGSEQEKSITVKIKQDLKPSFFVGMFYNPLKINVSATAQVMGSANICVIAFEETAPQAISASATAGVRGDGCAIFSNSTDPNGIVASDSGYVNSAMTCSAGGYNGTESNFDPEPVTDCPKRNDPLADRPMPSGGACDHTALDVTTSQTLNPGVYCQTLRITGNATLNPGVYIMRNSVFQVANYGKVTGEGVTIFFEGDSTLFFDLNSTISLSAPTTGDTAGILMFQDRNASPGIFFDFASNNAKDLVGAIYLPKGHLSVFANAPVADKSAWTAILVNSLQVRQTAELVLNSDFDATDVPVPDGLAGAGGSIMLRQ